MPLPASDNTDYELPHCFKCRHGPWAFTWPVVAAQATDIHIASGCNTDHQHQHGLKGQHGPQTSRCSLAVIWAGNINMISGGSTDHGHLHGLQLEWPLVVTQTMNIDTALSGSMDCGHWHHVQWQHGSQTLAYSGSIDCSLPTWPPSSSSMGPWRPFEDAPCPPPPKKKRTVLWLGHPATAQSQGDWLHNTAKPAGSLDCCTPCCWPFSAVTCLLSTSATFAHCCCFRSSFFSLNHRRHSILPSFPSTAQSGIANCSVSHSIYPPQQLYMQYLLQQAFDLIQDCWFLKHH